MEKAPGLAEAIDWLAVLCALGVTTLDRRAVTRTLGAIVKSPEDRDLVLTELDTHEFAAGG